MTTRLFDSLASTHEYSAANLSYAKDLYDAEAGAKKAKKNVSGTVSSGSFVAGAYPYALSRSGHHTTRQVRRRSRWTKAVRLSRLNIST